MGIQNLSILGETSQVKLKFHRYLESK